jgi:pSer/pThr/pTyr-binding forkhead associated (FHA) protein
LKINNVIKVSLLHPLQSTPVQSWKFADESIIRIGRALDNQVVLYSAVVSRHHVEVRRIDRSWQIVSLGANGTYVDDEPISQVPVVNEVIIRLASSGSKSQIRFESVTSI